MADAPDNCPFCGHDYTFILNGPVEGDWCAVTCDKCHARGPINYTDPHAIAEWNTRATPPAAVVEAMERALQNIRELNLTAEDENGHKWANSELIDQEITFSLAALTAWRDAQ